MASDGRPSPPGRPALDVPSTRFTVDEHGMGNAGTNTAPFNPRLTTHDGRQFFAYWDHDGRLQLAARELPDGPWRASPLDVDIERRDGHWAPALGVGPDGHVFVCYNTRNSPIRWRRSESPGAVSAFGEERTGMTGDRESSACYPEFTRLRDGTLLFGYRAGYSGNGDWVLNRWDDIEDTWRPLQHPLTDGENARNSYHWNLVQSDDGTLHTFFCWRNNDRPGIGNSDLCYARSPDGGGTWERSDGTPYGLPIRKATSEVVDDIAVENNFVNNGWASYDPRTDEPHVAYYRDDAAGHTQIYHACRADGRWLVEPVTDRASDIHATGFVRSTDPKTLSRPGIVVDDDGSVFILARDAERGGWPLVFGKVDGRWGVEVLYRRNLVSSDIHLDPERWRTDRVLSFVDQPQTNRRYDPPGGAPWASASLIRVTDVVPRRAESTDAPRHGRDAADVVTFASASLSTPETVTGEGFEPVPLSLTVTEATLPATPVLARCTAAVRHDDGSAVAFGLAFEDLAGQSDEDLSTTAGTVQTGHDAPVRTTGWVRVPGGIRAGRVTVRARCTESATAAALASATLELAYRDPRPSLDTLVA